ncbi:MAG: hypothetical protein H0Z29_01125 [Candidatus Marinimicrobia bacterium]|nr:hypothetical protein [Candidatus Neomarinimicrobiota bacterium]
MIKVYVEKETLQEYWTQEILKYYKNYEIINSEEEIFNKIQPEEMKNTLLVKKSKGEIVKDCPGTQESYLCCGYKVINQTINCPLDCSYCILQYYINKPVTIIYTDFEDIFKQAEKLIKIMGKNILRIGTGELSDSLAHKGTIVFAKEAVKFFSKKKNVFFELKTKTTNIDEILNVEHNENIVLSWSVNPDKIVMSEEKLSASLSARIKAAKRSIDAGFLVGFHFDPIVYYKNCEIDYEKVVDMIYENIPPEKIAWISLGSLRYPPATKDKISDRHPETKIIYQEMIKGLDGKLRYPRPLRTMLYRKVYDKLMNVNEPPFVYFCMESKEVWQDIMGWYPENNEEFENRFAIELYKRFKHSGLIKPKRKFKF